MAKSPASSSVIRHLTDLAKLAIPMIVSRAGLATMGMADAVMVSRFSPPEFAALTLADGTLGRIIDVFAAFILGGLVLVPRAFGSGDMPAAIRIWHRSLAPAFGLGLLGCIIGFFGTNVFHLLGQSAALSSEAGKVSAILGLGYVAALLALAAAIFLEGIQRPIVVALSVVLANLLNIALNWFLIGGHAGFAPLGARGSAISTTVVRCLLAVVLVAFAVRSRQAKVPVSSAPEASNVQHQLGLAAAIVQAIMLMLTSSLLVFAGWMGALPLAVLSAIWTLNGPAMLIAFGVADATAIRVASEDGKRSGRGSIRQIVSFSGITTAFVILFFIAVWWLFPSALASVFTNNTAMLAGLIPLIPLASGLIILDGVSFVVVAALRALRDIVWPTGIEIATMAALVPLAALLAFRLSQGVRGLIIAAIATAACRTALLIWRFARLTATADQP